MLKKQQTKEYVRNLQCIWCILQNMQETKSPSSSLTVGWKPEHMKQPKEHTGNQGTSNNLKNVQETRIPGHIQRICRKPGVIIH